MAQVGHRPMPDKGELCYISALSPELIDNILSYLDSVRSLGNFITTCRFVYRCFEGREATILLRVLQNGLGPVLADAMFLRVLPPSGPNEYQTSHLARIQGMAPVYRKMLGDGGPSQGRRGDVSVPSFAELADLCPTLRSMNFLADTYFAAQLRSFGDSAAERPATAALSFAERLRVLRALYRRQIVCNTWPSWSYGKTGHKCRWTVRDVVAISNPSDHKGLPLGLFGTFEPWELQQIDHVDYFVGQLCAALCLAARNGAQAISEAEFSDIFSNANRLVQYMKEHVDIVDAALGVPLSPLRLDSGQLVDLDPMIDHWHIMNQSLPCLSHSWQIYRYNACPDPRRDHPERGEVLTDGAPRPAVKFTEDSVDLPPFGWVDAVGERCMNCFGLLLNDATPSTPGLTVDMSRHRRHFISVMLWRDAGFTLWDRRRVEAIKKLDWAVSLQTQWLTGG